MKLLEHQLVGKLGRMDLCEDAWNITPHFACVIDGATSKGGLSFGNQTSGRMASILLKEALKSLPPESTLAEAVNFFTEVISKFCKERDIYSSLVQKHWDRLTASMAVYSMHHQEVWLIGDVQCYVNGVFHTVPKAIDKTLAEMRSNYIHALMQTGKSVEDLLDKDEGREFILPMLKSQSRYQNTQPQHPYSYTVIDGFEPNYNGVRTISVLDKGEIVLATDGYPKLCRTLADSEAYLAKVLSEDPLCFDLFPSTKGCYTGQLSFDDRAYLRLKV